MSGLSLAFCWKVTCARGGRRDVHHAALTLAPYRSMKLFFPVDSTEIAPMFDENHERFDP